MPLLSTGPEKCVTSVEEFILKLYFRSYNTADPKEVSVFPCHCSFVIKPSTNKFPESISPNVIIGSKGVFKTSSGLTVAYMSGSAKKEVTWYYFEPSK